MPTLLTPEPPKPSAFALLMRALYILIPVTLSSFATYKQSQSESESGYKALVQSVLQLQTEVKELHERSDILQARNLLLNTELSQLAADMRQATSDETVEELPVVVEAPKAPHIYEAKPPPATLQDAVKQDAKF